MAGQGPRDWPRRPRDWPRRHSPHSAHRLLKLLVGAPSSTSSSRDHQPKTAPGSSSPARTIETVHLLLPTAFRVCPSFPCQHLQPPFPPPPHTHTYPASSCSISPACLRLDPTGPLGGSWWDPPQDLEPFLLSSCSPTSHFLKVQDRMLDIPTSFPFSRPGTANTGTCATFSCRMPLADITDQSHQSLCTESGHNVDGLCPPLWAANSSQSKPALQAKSIYHSCLRLIPPGPQPILLAHQHISHLTPFLLMLGQRPHGYTSLL